MAHTLLSQAGPVDHTSTSEMLIGLGASRSTPWLRELMATVQRSTSMDAGASHRDQLDLVQERPNENARKARGQVVVPELSWLGIPSRVDDYRHPVGLLVHDGYRRDITVAGAR